MTNSQMYRLTAMAVHALAMRKPKGWDWQFLRHAVGFGQFRTYQMWIELDCPDSVYLTVLVLDALELAAGGTKVTFDLRCPPGTQRVKRESVCRDKSRLDILKPSLVEGIDDSSGTG